MNSLTKRIIQRLFGGVASIYIVCLVLMVIISIIKPQFFSPTNFYVLARQIPILGILAIAETIVIIGGEIDLSIASVAALSCMIGAIVMYNGYGFWLGTIAVLTIGLIFGLLNGIITAKFKLPAFLVTLGSATAANGLTYIVSGGISIPIRNEAFVKIWGTGEIGPVPVLFIWLILIILISYIILHRTVFGIHLFATGGNEVAASYSGVNTRLVKMKALLISGLMSSFAGLLLLGRLSSGRVGVLLGSELDAIAATIIGGTSLFGGVGSIYAPLIGTFVLTIISNGVVMLGLVLGYEWLVRGIIVIAAVIMGRRKV